MHALSLSFYVNNTVHITLTHLQYALLSCRSKVNPKADKGGSWYRLCSETNMFSKNVVRKCCNFTYIYYSVPAWNVHNVQYMYTCMHICQSPGTLNEDGRTGLGESREKIPPLPPPPPIPLQSLISSVYSPDSLSQRLRMARTKGKVVLYCPAKRESEPISMLHFY